MAKGEHRQLNTMVQSSTHTAHGGASERGSAHEHQGSEHPADAKSAKVGTRECPPSVTATGQRIQARRGGADAVTQGDARSFSALPSQRRAEPTPQLRHCQRENSKLKRRRCDPGWEARHESRASAVCWRSQSAAEGSPVKTVRGRLACRSPHLQVRVQMLQKRRPSLAPPKLLPSSQFHRRRWPPALKREVSATN